MQGLPPAAAECLGRYRFLDTKAFVLRPSLDLTRAVDRVAALHATLAQLRALEAPGAEIRFSGWQWSQALADVLTEALPSLSHLNITVPEVPL